MDVSTGHSRPLRHIRRGLLAFGMLLAAGGAQACIWDRDTLAAEARGLPQTVHVITGRFERNPPLFYSMRLRHTQAEIDRDPGRLEAYDDAAVACDRLGRPAEAIALMERKREQLDRLPTGDARLREHRYRYLANLGTFWAHRWIAEGADRKRLDMVRRARDLIRRAIKLNPDAHFGREKYQLRALEWILSPPELKLPGHLPNLLNLDYEAYAKDPGELARLGMPDAVKGLSGLIVLGNAWESVDVYHTLALALQTEGRSSLAYLAHVRCEELIDQGRRSLHPEAPTGAELKKLLHTGEHPIQSMEPLQAEYRRLRREADAWQAHRTEFMLTRLQAGRHPDTDPTFWTGYREAPAPALKGDALASWPAETLAIVAAGAGLAAAALGIAVAFRRRRCKGAPPAGPATLRS